MTPADQAQLLAALNALTESANKLRAAIEAPRTEWSTAKTPERFLDVQLRNVRLAESVAKNLGDAEGASRRIEELEKIIDLGKSENAAQKQRIAFVEMELWASRNTLGSKDGELLSQTCQRTRADRDRWEGRANEAEEEVSRRLAVAVEQGKEIGRLRSHLETIQSRDSAQMERIRSLENQTHALISEAGQLRRDLAAAKEAATSSARATEAALIARVTELEKQKDGAYSERNQCVALIARMAQRAPWAVGVRKHEGEDWEDDWRTVLFVQLPTGQVSWHFHHSERHLLSQFPVFPWPWDGHDTTEKYRRVNACLLPGPVSP